MFKLSLINFFYFIYLKSFCSVFCFRQGDYYFVFSIPRLIKAIQSTNPDIPSFASKFHLFMQYFDYQERQLIFPAN
jgi:hypothetical protein